MNRVSLMGVCIFVFAFSFTSENACAQSTQIRLATYNIRFLDKDKLPHQGSRKTRLISVIDQLEADVIGMQEIESREALEMIFDTDEWDLVIDHDPDEKSFDQDLALAVRKSTLEILGMPENRVADEDDFLFPNGEFKKAFIGDRDVLKTKLRVKETGEEFTVFVAHYKSRKDGRPKTDWRREYASKKLVERLDARYDGEPYVLLADLNDNPDDRSSNILETGDPNATAGAENDDGPFMFNLCEKLIAADHVSHGQLKVNEAGQINTVVPGSRNQNNYKRGQNYYVKKVMLDNIFVSPDLMRHYREGSVRVFDGGVAAQGGNNRASDHLPVYADFVFGETEPASVSIVAMLPNPRDLDSGNETITLRNNTDDKINLDGWLLKDRGGREFGLDGKSINGNEKLTITLPANTVTLTNAGDTISLINPSNVIESRKSYTKSEADTHEQIQFE